MQNLIDQYGMAGMALLGAVAVGLAIDAVVFRLVRGRALKQHWATGEALAHALHGLPTAVSLVVGVQLAIARLGWGPTALERADTGVEVAWIVLATAFIARIAARLIRAYTQRDDAKLPASTIFVNLARGTVWIIGGLVLLGSLGISITPLITAMGVGGLAIGLALQPTLENLFSGIQVLLSKQVEPGDFVRLETGEEGHVQDVTWRNTTIKALSNDLVIIPNATLGKSLVTNFTSADEQHVIWVPVGVSYSSDLERVEATALEVARETISETPCAVSEYEPLLRFMEFGDSSINLKVSMRAKTYGDRWFIRHEFIKKLHRRFDNEGIDIPFPQRTVHIQPTEAEDAG